MKKIKETINIRRTNEIKTRIIDLSFFFLMGVGYWEWMLAETQVFFQDFELYEPRHETTFLWCFRPGPT